MSTAAPTLWLGGAQWNGVDQTPRFLREGIWENGYNDKYLEKVRAVRPGDLFVIKATATQKANLPFPGEPERFYSKMILRAKGTVRSNPADGRTLHVDWEADWPERTWWHYTFQGTIWRPRRSDWRAKALRDFVVKGVAQDHAAFLGTPAAAPGPLHRDIQRVLGRLPLRRGQLLVLKTVLDDPDGATEGDLLEALQGALPSRVLWALGRRIRYTERETAHEGVDLLFDVATDEEGALRYVARTELRETVARDVPLASFLAGDPEAVSAGSPWTSSGAALPDAPTPPRPLPTLQLWSFEDQYKGMATTGGLTRPLEVLRAARSPIGQADLLAHMGEELGFAHAKESTRRASLSRLQALGLLRRKADGTWEVSDTGRRAVDQAHLSPIVEAFLVRVFGIAQLVRLLEPASSTRADVVHHFREVYPGWTSNTPAIQLINWCRELELVDQDGPRLSLTDFGRSWAARLPAHLPMPEASTSEVEPLPPLDALIAWMDVDDHARRFVFPRASSRNVLAAWRFHRRKRFVLLSGLSGTGKTQLLLQLARATCGCLGLPEDEHIALVAVSPDWHDPTGLLGHLNTLHAMPRFHPEPALELLKRAAQNPGLPYFLLLDEMNLAPVERWFAPFLSAMESGSPLVLHGETDDVDGIPPQLDWPANLRIAGTVNMDETTHAFSDKVLDRAFTFEFWAVDLDALFAKRPSPSDEERVVRTVLVDLQAALTPIRRGFGYRSAEEVLDWVAASRTLDPQSDFQAVLDQALLSKILPRVRGADATPLRTALDTLLGLTRTHGLPLCASKLAAMKQRLEDTGVTGFWS